MIWVALAGLRLIPAGSIRDAPRASADRVESVQIVRWTKRIHWIWWGPKMTMPAFQDCPPLTERVSAYDERHLATYVRLLMAEEEGADWREVVLVLFGLDPTREPDRAKIVHDSHLARARWMTETGYRHLLEPRMH